MACALHSCVQEPVLTPVDGRRWGGPSSSFAGMPTPTSQLRGWGHRPEHTQENEREATALEEQIKAAVEHLQTLVKRYIEVTPWDKGAQVFCSCTS